MKVLHLADRLTDRGGTYRHLFGIIESQAEAHEVSLAAGCDDGSVAAPCSFRILPGLEARLRAPVAIEALVEELRPDVVHVHNVVNPEALERVGALESVVPVITVQDHRFFCPSRGKWTFGGEHCHEAMSRELCRSCFDDAVYFHEIYEVTSERLRSLQAYRIVTLSHYMKRELVAAGFVDDRIHVVPPFVHGLDLDTPGNGSSAVLFAGRLVASKGVLDAVVAWKLAEISLPLVIAGSGPLRSELEGSGAELLGWIPHHRVASLYRRAAALLMPSRWQEPFGIVGLEALTLGTPVVAWESGGIAEWHPGPLVAWGDVEGLARRLRDTVGRGAERPKGFDRKTLMNRLDEVYRLP